MRVRHMIYTVGRQAAYDAYIASDPRPEKMGKGKDHQGNDYGGGSVFETAMAAAEYLREFELLSEYAVYSLDADWMNDTEQLPGEPYRRLLRDAVITGRMDIHDA